MEQIDSIYRILLESSSDVYILSDDTGTILFISPQIEPLTGWTTEAFIGSNLNSFLKLADNLQFPFEGGNFKAFQHREFSGIFKSRNSEPINVAGSIFKIDQSDKYGIKIRPDTDRLQAANKLQAINEQLKERVKEQSCLYQISKLSVEQNTIEDYFSKIVEIIPSGFKYVDQVNIQMEFGDVLVNSHGFKQTDDPIVSRRKTESGLELILTIDYADKDRIPEIAFLEEERRLVEQIADLILISLSNIEALRKVRESELRMKMILDSEPECVKIVSDSGLLLEMNDAGLMIIEAEGKRKEVIGKPVKNVIHPEDIEKFNKLHEDALLGEKRTAQFRIKGLNSSIKWVESTAVGLANENGLIDSVLSITRDITDKLKREEALKRSNENFKSLVETIDGIVWEADAATIQFTFVSPQAETILGYPVERWLNEPNFWIDHIHQDDREQTVQYCKEQSQRGNDHNFEYRFIAADGRAVWIQDFVSVVRRRNEPTLLRGVMLDISARKKAESEAIRANNEIQRIYEFSLDILCTFDASGKIIRISSAAENIIGYEVNALLGKNILELIVEEDRDEILKSFNELISGKQLTSIENRLIHKNGTIIPMFWSAAFDAKNNLFHCVGKDASEFKNAENKIKQLINNTDEAFVMLDMNLNIVAFNKKFDQLYSIYFGKSVVPDTHILDYAQPERRDMLSQMYQRVFEGNEESSQVRIPLSDNTVKIFDIRYKPARNEYNDIIGVFVSAFDVTEREYIFEELLKSNERFTYVTHATFDAIWDYDLLTGSLYWGTGFTKLFGYPIDQGEQTLNNWQSKVHPDDFEKVMDKVNAVLNSTENFWLQEYRFLKSDGDYAFVKDRGVVIRDESGKAIRIIGAIADNTQQKNFEISLLKLNQQLKERAEELAISNKELEQFAYVASHDLQEPLRMVTSFLVQLEKKYADILDSKGRQYIHFAVDGAKRMRQIILDLLEFSRVGRSNDKIESVDLKEIVDEIKFLYKAEIHAQKATIQAGKLPTVKLQRTPIRQVFQNLISNGLKYRKKDVSPLIKIDVKDAGKFWEISVEDNGIGIHPDYFEKIFLIFQRLHHRSEYEGSGMGLAVTKKIIENLGGQIWVSSDESTGSVFYFTLPK